MSEHDHQVAVFRWAELNLKRMPELAVMYAIPNAAKRSARLAAMMKAEGLKAGVPDICLPVQKQGYGSLYIELKRPKTKGKPPGKMSQAQSRFLNILTKNGNLALVAYGWEDAVEIIEAYLTIDAVPGKI